MLSERKAFSFINLVLLLGIVGLFQLASFGFHLPHLLSIYFWYKLIYRMVIKLLCDRIGFNFMFDTHDNSEELKFAREEYITLNKLRKRDFPDYIMTVHNPKVKEQYYTELVKKRKTKILKKIERKPGNTKLVSKLHNLESPYDVSAIAIDYPKTFESDFFSDDSSDFTAINKTRPQFNKAVNRYSRKNLLTTLVITIITGAVIFDLSGADSISFWINLLFDIILVVNSLGMAMFNSKRIFNGEYLISVKTKIEILKSYLDWRTEQGTKSLEDVLDVEREQFENKINEIKQEIHIESVV